MPEDERPWQQHHTSDAPQDGGRSYSHSQRRPLRRMSSARPGSINSRTSLTSRWSTAGPNPHRGAGDGEDGGDLQPLLGDIRQQQEQMHPSDHNYAYIQDGYRDLNPFYDTPQVQQIWGLGRTFPRVVRPGMMRKIEEEKKKEKRDKRAKQEHPNPQHTIEEENEQKEERERNKENAADIQSLDGAGDFGQGPPGGPARWTEEERVRREREKKEEADGRVEEEDEGTRRKEDDEYEDEGLDEEVTEYLNRWCKIRHHLREPLAEWLATMIVIFLGTCANLQVTTSLNKDGGWQQKSWAWGLGTMLGIYVAGGVSGAHLNPLISLSLSLFRGFPLKRCLIYIIAQLLGALCGALLAYGLYKDAIHGFDPGLHVMTSGTAFFTMPTSGITLTTAFFNEVAVAAVMAGTILALGDESNSPPGAGMHSFIIGLDVTVLVMSLGYNTGPSLNPARDITGRLAAWWVGYGVGMWDRGWWILSIVASMFGGIVGSLLYDLAVFVGGESPVNYPKRQRRRKVARKGRFRSYRAYQFYRKKQKGQDIEARQG